MVMQIGQAVVSTKMLHNLLKSCITKGNVVLDRRVHAISVRIGYGINTSLGAHFIRFYAAQRSLVEAKQVFNKLPAPDAHAWTAIISAYRANGQPGEAIKMYHLMRESKVKPNDYTFMAVLKACTSAPDLSSGKLVHSHVVENGLQSNLYLGSILMGMYSKWGSLEDARTVFEALPRRDVVAWTALIAGYAQRGFCQEALTLYDDMLQDGVTPDSYAFSSILKACAGAGAGAVQKGKKIHSQILDSGLETAAHVVSALVGMYVKCGELEDARRVFDKLTIRDVVTWNVLMAGYVQRGLAQEALNLYLTMQLEGPVPDAFIYATVLKACGTIGAVQEGRRIHGEIRQRGKDADSFVANSLVDMYIKCGSLEDARKVFDRIQLRGSMEWSTLIAGYAQHGLSQEAIQLYKSMRRQGVTTNYVTYVSILKACGNLGAIQEGEQIHAEILRHGLEANLLVGTALVDMYVKCESLLEARKVFDSLQSKDLVTWSVMIAGYAQHGLGHKGLELYKLMQQDGMISDNVTFVNILKACGSIGAIQEGRRIHAEIRDRGLETDAFVSSSLMVMYTKCGSLEDARRIFDRLPCKDVVPWSIMIAGYAEHGCGEEALKLYKMMQQDSLSPANEVTFVSVLKACGSLGDLKELKHIHAEILERRSEADTMVGNTLIDMYAKCGSIEDARVVFDRLPTRDLVTWSTIIAGYAQHGIGQEALQLYKSMKGAGMDPDQVILVSVLKACGSTGAIEEGKQVHAHIIQWGLERDMYVGNTLVDMYAKFGRLEDACKVFAKLPTRDVVTWNALINGYGQHNACEKAIESFENMQKQGIEPDAETFTALLVSCSLAGLVDKGQHYFELMKERNDPTAGLQHYTCMVDLLGRSGRLDEAENVLLTMPHTPDSVAWMSLLSACKTYGNAELGRRCFDRLIKLNPQQAAPYVLMSNIYASASRWAEVNDVENLRNAAGAQKKLAKALIEVDKRVHEFTVGQDRNDTSAVLKNLNARVKEGTDAALKVLSDKEREDALCGHAEKLAVAFGLLNTPEGTPLLVIKNLRMCHHCHSGTKIISGVEKREIIVRDAHRVHHFKAGTCSCGDDL